jgi:cholesterol oxidase
MRGFEAMGGTAHYDAAVVGSGFGGSVAAARLAEAGRRVLVLERGKAYAPGDFPRTPAACRRNFWDPGAGLHGLFDVWSFRGIDALVASGLGGGSLIYANVLLRKDSFESWPIAREELDPHYEVVERRLGATPYPVTHEPYASTPKTRAFRDAARRAGHEPFGPPLAIAFAPAEGEAPVTGEPLRDAPSLHGRTRQTCRLCAECTIGCNYGAKNTLDHTFLTDAAADGAEVRTRCEARTIEPVDGGYEVGYVVHEAAREGEETATDRLPLHRVRADRVILAAGALSTTFLLLRNRERLPGLSGALGTRFSGNGDLLTFALRCRVPTEGGSVPRELDPSRGPTITSAIRGEDFYLQEAGLPVIVAWLLGLLEAPRAMRRARPLVRGLVGTWRGRHRDPAVSAEISALFGDGTYSTALLPLLGMGLDVPDGVARLVDGALDVHWRKDGASAPFFDRLRAVSRDVARALGGGFADNPSWWLNRLITVHPLGGAPMGATHDEGVVDPFGAVFGHPGLYVLDGAAMPGPVGPNPALTIAAFADRGAEAMLATPPATARRAALR